MTESGRKREGERPGVGVVAPERDASHVVRAVGDAGVDAVTGPAATDAVVVVAVGDAALAALADAGTSTPVVPAETGFGPFDASLEARIERALTGTDGGRECPVFRVETPSETGHALFEVALTAAEPATISGFSVAAAVGEATDDLEAIARFRADGVAVATPAGSDGYARAAGGPVVASGTDAAAVVPVAPFSTNPDHWVVPLSAIGVTVERDVDVTVTVDGRPLETVSPGSDVHLVHDGMLRVVTPPTTGKSETF